MAETTAQNELLLSQVKKAIDDLAEDKQAFNLQECASNPSDCAKVHMGLAFAINSLFYCKSKSQKMMKKQTISIFWRV